jgi:FtsP/CotA-like multicopper oxidase with cupredoxin domain
LPKDLVTPFDPAANGGHDPDAAAHHVEQAKAEPLTDGGLRTAQLLDVALSHDPRHHEARILRERLHQMVVPRWHFPLTPDSAVDKLRYVTFGMQFPGKANPVVGIDFLINNQQYDERAAPNVVSLGSTEDWVIGSPGHPAHPASGSISGHMNNTEGHPFHIHVNSFEVIGEADVAPDGTVTNEVRYPEDEVLIQDTIWVPMGKQVTIRNTFKQWTGKAVYHCHILPHEDTGMMQNFLILDTPHGGHGHDG